MTAEIAIMNKSTVTLAADSTITLKQRGGLKVYRSTNKLFPLTKKQPIGVMTYGNAVIMGIPWETVIGIYANHLGSKTLSSLEDYGRDLIQFLSQEKNFFPAKVQTDHLNNVVHRFFQGAVKAEIDKQIKLTLEKQKRIDDKEVKKYVTDIIEKIDSNLKKAKSLPDLPANFGEETVKKHSPVIEKNIKDVFQKLPIDAKLKDKLKNIIANLLNKDLFLPAVSSGVVIAGFGESEFFPSVYSVLIEGMIDDKLKWKEYKRDKITYEASSSIIPFAQIDMVYTFMEGIDPILDSFLKGYIEELLTNFPQTVIDNVKILDEEQKKVLSTNFQEATKKTLEKFFSDMRNYRKSNHTFPIISSIAAQPAYELAMLAESLINLTSLKQRVTFDVESVGGPVDVAIITKTDGFVWVKKKQFNPQEAIFMQ